MYQIYADSTLIYDSTLEDYKIGKGDITLEVGKSGSFVFSVHPDHFYFDSFVKLKTVVTVYKSGRIVFRGRILNDVTDYGNNKTITCEGELGFLNDSVVRPFSFQGDHTDLFADFVAQHNAQVDEFKRFKPGTVTVADPNNYVNRSSTEYGTTLSTMTGALTDSSLGGYFYITHGDDGTDPIPTLHYVADFPKRSSQSIEFGSNLKDYVKTLKAEEVATAIIPLGTTNSTEGHRLTIADVNNGLDYIYDEAAVALYGWVFKTVVWEDVTLANNLLTKAQEYLEAVVNQSLTIELNAIDLHLLDRSIESFEVCSYVPVVSPPHKLDTVLLCNKQTMSLLKPETDSIVLGVHIVPFTSGTTQMAASISTLGKTVSSIRQDGESIKLSVEKLGESMSELELLSNGLSLSVTNKSTSATIQLMAGDDALGSPATINMAGLVTFSGLSDGTTTIDGGCIKTGSISADRIKGGSITGVTIKSTGEGYGDIKLEGGVLSVGVASMWTDDQFLRIGGTPYVWLEGTEVVSINVAGGYRWEFRADGITLFDQYDDPVRSL